MKGGANWIDFLAIVPFYLGIIAGDVLDAISVFRVIRLARSPPAPAPPLRPCCTHLTALPFPHVVSAAFS